MVICNVYISPRNPYKEVAMDWIICIGGGLFFGALLALANIFSRWADDAEKGGVYRRK